MRHTVLIAAAALALTACSRGGDDANQLMADANASGAEASAAVENAVVNSADTPVERDRALALMEERHEGYERIGRAYGAAKRAIDNGNAEAVKAPAELIASLAPQAIGWFPVGSGPDVGKTDAKAEIWQQRADFDRGMQEFNSAARAFQAAANGGDLTAIREAHANLGKTCGSCHDRFRVKKD